MLENTNRYILKMAGSFSIVMKALILSAALSRQEHLYLSANVGVENRAIEVMAVTMNSFVIIFRLLTFGFLIKLYQVKFYCYRKTFMVFTFELYGRNKHYN